MQTFTVLMYGVTKCIVCILSIRNARFHAIRAYDITVTGTNLLIKVFHCIGSDYSGNCIILLLQVASVKKVIKRAWVCMFLICIYSHSLLTM